MGYKNYMKQQFGITENDEYSKEFLEITQDFLTLYSMYEESFQLRGRSLSLGIIENKIKAINKNIAGIDELYEHFYDRYTKNPEKKIKLFRPRIDDTYSCIFENCLQKDKKTGVTNLEKQVFLGMLANRYRNNTLHGSKEYRRWHEYKEEFNILNKYLYLWLTN